MPKDDLVYAGHTLDTARKALRMIEGKSRADYDQDEALQLALTHLLQTIGEAARRLSADFRAAHPEIPCAAIVGVRHGVVHDYLHVDFDVVWDVVTRDLPALAARLNEVLRE